MQFIFIANTAEEMRQEIVKFLRRAAELNASAKNLTKSKRTQAEIQAQVDQINTILEVFEKAKIEPGPVCKNCGKLVRMATKEELQAVWGPNCEIEDWKHVETSFWGCRGSRGEVAEV